MMEKRPPPELLCPLLSDPSALEDCQRDGCALWEHITGRCSLAVPGYLAACDANAPEMRAIVRVEGVDYNVTVNARAIRPLDPHDICREACACYERGLAKQRDPP